MEHVDTRYRDTFILDATRQHSPSKRSDETTTDQVSLESTRLSKIREILAKFDEISWRTSRFLYLRILAHQIQWDRNFERGSTQNVTNASSRNPSMILREPKASVHLPHSHMRRHRFKNSDVDIQNDEMPTGEQPSLPYKEAEKLTRQFYEDNFRPSKKHAVVPKNLCRLPTPIILSLRNVQRKYANPTFSEVYNFIRHICIQAAISPECVMIMVIYVDRLMFSKGIMLIAATWKPILLVCLLIASKMWEDISSWNSQFSHVCRDFPLKGINKMEAILCEMLDFNFHVDGELYSRYCEVLRSLYPHTSKDVQIQPQAQSSNKSRTNTRSVVSSHMPSFVTPVVSVPLPRTPIHMYTHNTHTDSSRVETNLQPVCIQTQGTSFVSMMGEEGLLKSHIQLALKRDAVSFPLMNGHALTSQDSHMESDTGDHTVTQKQILSEGLLSQTELPFSCSLQMLGEETPTNADMCNNDSECEKAFQPNSNDTTIAPEDTSEKTSEASLLQGYTCLPSPDNNMYFDSMAEPF